MPSSVAVAMACCLPSHPCFLKTTICFIHPKHGNAAVPYHSIPACCNIVAILSQPNSDCWWDKVVDLSCSCWSWLGHLSKSILLSVYDYECSKVEPLISDYILNWSTFLECRGISVNKVPVLNGTIVDIYDFYLQVVNMGGYKIVAMKNLWMRIAEDLKISKNNMVGRKLKEIYWKWLLDFEFEENLFNYGIG